MIPISLVHETRAPDPHRAPPCHQMFHDSRLTAAISLSAAAAIEARRLTWIQRVRMVTMLLIGIASGVLGTTFVVACWKGWV